MQWLITGCSSGLGLSLAQAVLEQPGQKVIATSRSPASPEAVQSITSHQNGAWEALDVAAADIEARYAAIVAKHGPVDVLINNAGFAAGGIFEATPVDLARRQYETNFFGAFRLMQCVLPVLRESGKGGAIVNISSSVFWQPQPSTTTYASSKWALEGLSEALVPEVASFNIRVLIAEPGGMRTPFFDPAKLAANTVPLPDTYKGSPADMFLQAITSGGYVPNLDTDKAARAIVKEVLTPTVVQGEAGKPSVPILRLPLGGESFAAMQETLARVTLEGEKIKPTALSCDYDA
ncbi:hypothetical protein A1O1_07227 [Capronia coronata CBS 617.96]|uniref:Ketoreductase domain-containing protein n=1 Tax=Capronia coronata CBS 617.96 TaxID=1182541 RepID=W9YMV7_9EURO|nr:uncharacterized protein A1O1_07227 [Capronia coronata CBS 617.96]EXJ83604.1 hypothetical protein A1O1_07227 [Capronia coronata CBS 617.96]